MRGAGPPFLPSLSLPARLLQLFLLLAGGQGRPWRGAGDEAQAGVRVGPRRLPWKTEGSDALVT